MPDNFEGSEHPNPLMEQSQPTMTDTFPLFVSVPIDDSMLGTQPTLLPGSTERPPSFVPTVIYDSMLARFPASQRADIRTVVRSFDVTRHRIKSNEFYWREKENQEGKLGQVRPELDNLLAQWMNPSLRTMSIEELESSVKAAQAAHFNCMMVLALLEKWGKDIKTLNDRDMYVKEREEYFDMKIETVGVLRTVLEIMYPAMII